MWYMKVVCCSIICFCCLMSSCGTPNNKDKGEFWSEIELGGGGPTLQYLRETPARTLEMDAELALKIGDAVLEATYGAEALEGLVFIVTDCEKEGWFWVARGPDQDICPHALDGGYNVAIEKKTGEIIKIWQDGIDP